MKDDEKMSLTIEFVLHQAVALIERWIDLLHVPVWIHLLKAKRLRLQPQIACSYESRECVQSLCVRCDRPHSPQECRAHRVRSGQLPRPGIA